MSQLIAHICTFFQNVISNSAYFLIVTSHTEKITFLLLKIISTYAFLENMVWCYDIAYHIMVLSHAFSHAQNSSKPQVPRLGALSMCFISLDKAKPIGHFIYSLEKNCVGKFLMKLDFFCLLFKLC